MKSYRQNKMTTTSINRNTSQSGETIETKVERLVNNKEQIDGGKPLIYTEKRAGVAPSYDIRTDRFEIAVEAMDKITASNIASSENQPLEDKEIGEAEPTHGTDK